MMQTRKFESPAQAAAAFTTLQHAVINRDVCAFAVIPHGDRLSVAAFQGKSAKPAKYYGFRDRNRAVAFINEFANAAKQSAEARAKRAAEQAAQRVAFVNPYSVGDILESSWGYDQTNRDFYVVVEVSAKSVILQKCGSKCTRSDGGGADYVVADPSHTEGERKRHLVGLDGSVKVRDWGVWARKWDGRELYETAAGWGH